MLIAVAVAAEMVVLRNTKLTRDSIIAQMILVAALGAVAVGWSERRAAGLPVEMEGLTKIFILAATIAFGLILVGCVMNAVAPL
jgi:hypothetical protein